ncbi:MAG TPA: hypothetical protein VFO85_14325, partial [Vicinamibacteria bacterium]|nr:hypothetical protein [Vicinamibacteria bacterium]
MRGRFRVPLFLAVATFTASLSGAAAPGTTLEAEVARWSDFLRTHQAPDALWKDVKQSTEPALVRVQKALDEGHLLLALLRFAPVRENLAAAAYVGQRSPAQHQDMAAVEAEWKRMGGVLAAHLGPPAPAAAAGLRPALVRALAEAALPQVRIYYEASVDYGRSTTPDAGLFYLGAAQAARDFAALAGRLALPAAGAPPPLRSLAAELDTLEAEMLAAYKPPLSIDKHREFIGASSALKEARELEAAGLRHGALLRYLQAVLRFASLRGGGGLDAAGLGKRLAEAEARLDPAVDHSLARVFLQAARADLADPAAPAGAATAAAVVEEVLPRYRAALGPAPAPA